MFDQKEVQRWRRATWREFERMGYNAIQIQSALVLAAIAFFGTDPDVLSELTGLSVDYVRKVTRRLREQRVLKGKSISAAWGDQKCGDLAVALDAGVAAGMFARAVNPKRSAAQKARKPETYARGPRGERAPRESERIFRPTVKKSNPLYGLPEWEKKA